MKTKICPKCGIEKFIDKFNKDKNRKDGLTLWCKKCRLKYNKIYQEKNRKKIRKQNREYAKKYYKKYGNKIYGLRKLYQKQYQKNRRRNDPVFRLNCNISTAIYQSLKGNKNGQPWEKLVGYDCKELKKYLEAQFKDGMTWDNYGKWHLDHRIPVSLFNITGIKSKGFKKCWQLSNLQPLWEKENLEKSNKLFK